MHAAEGTGGDGSDGAKVVDADFEEVNPEDGTEDTKEDETKDEVKDGAETDSEDRGDADSEDGAGEPSDEDANFEDADPDKKKKEDQLGARLLLNGQFFEGPL
mgnify:CR=1 FL=1